MCGAFDCDKRGVPTERSEVMSGDDETCSSADLCTTDFPAEYCPSADLQLNDAQWAEENDEHHSAIYELCEFLQSLSEWQKMPSAQRVIII